jgi:hypothetical protein
LRAGICHDESDLPATKALFQQVIESIEVGSRQTETFKFSTDPDLEAKIRDAVGLFSLHRSETSSSRSTRRPIDDR